MRKRIMRAAAFGIIVSSAFAQQSQELETRTRFGTLNLDRQNMLAFRGHRLEPPIQPNSGMDMGAPYHIGATDVVLVTDYSGTACPFQYYFVSATKSGAKATPAFGTCNEVTSIKRSGDSISLTMHGFLGPFEPEAQRRKAFRETHIFVFRDGAVTENGKLAR
jgi:hypothetical protein